MRWLIIALALGGCVNTGCYRPAHYSIAPLPNEPGTLPAYPPFDER